MDPPKSNPAIAARPDRVSPGHRAFIDRIHSGRRLTGEHDGAAGFSLNLLTRFSCWLAVSRELMG